MSQTYCEKWFKAEKRPIGPLTVEAASELHERGKPYTVVDSSGASPHRVISVAPPWVTVVFLDDQLREHLTYDFKEVEPKKLFLSMATHREFDDVVDELIQVRRCAFDTSGRVLVEQRDLRTGEVWERETKDSLEENWEMFPQFGEYEGVGRQERELPAAHRHS